MSSSIGGCWNSVHASRSSMYFWPRIDKFVLALDARVAQSFNSTFCNLSQLSSEFSCLWPAKSLQNTSVNEPLSLVRCSGASTNWQFRSQVVISLRIIRSWFGKQNTAYDYDYVCMHLTCSLVWCSFAFCQWSGRNLALFDLAVFFWRRFLGQKHFRGGDSHHVV